jgi:hypothetical protein
MIARFLGASALAALVTVQALAATALQGQPAAGRSTVIISDLHMGPGRDASGGWHPYEDFRWSAEFSAFLEAINAQGKGAIDLVLNGDTFELLQPSAPDCGGMTELGCTEPQAMRRLERVLKAHEADLAALGKFARSGANKIVFVPGDHDAALLFPAVARRVVTALSVPAGRAEVAAGGYWSPDAQIYAEHGHQIGLSPHKFEKWPAPFERRPDGDRLVRPWGEQVIQASYNRLEERYPIVDNVAVSGAGTRFGLTAEGAVDLGETAPQLLRYLLATITWQQFRVELDDGEVEPPTWDLAQVRKQGPPFLVASFPEDDRFKPLAAKAFADGRLATSMEKLTDDELVAICDYRAAVRRGRRRFEPTLSQLSPRGPIIAECPRMPNSRGAIFEYFWRSRDSAFRRHIEHVAPRHPGTPNKIAVFVHGHTHMPDRSQARVIEITSGGLLKVPPEGFSPVRGALTPVAINGGAWQRTITPVQLDRLKEQRAVNDDELLRTVQPEHLAPCYSFVHIGPYSEAPTPTVRYWRRSAAGDWGMAEGCGL